jgi:hypothetical protein
MKSKGLIFLASIVLLSSAVMAKEPHSPSPTLKEADSESHGQVAGHVLIQQRQALAENTKNKGFGPQSPRDIDVVSGDNTRIFNAAPIYSAMNLCNIHFHKNAEHKGGQFTTFAGNGDGHGYQTGYRFTGNLTTDELKPVDIKVCANEHSELAPGDTIEVHYVHSSAQVNPGPTLGSCLSEAIGNPQLRVETQVYVVVNDKKALNFSKLTEHGQKMVSIKR